MVQEMAVALLYGGVHGEGSSADAIFWSASSTALCWHQVGQP
jgi:hypothetical protein